MHLQIIENLMANKAKAKKTSKANKANLASRIVDEAVRLGEIHGWSQVQLSDIAEHLNIPLKDILTHYRDTNDIANAFFAQATEAMVSKPNRRFDVLPPHEKIEVLMLAWFNHLAPHRQLSVEMLQAKLWVFHPHHWVPMVFDLSRLIQLMRDVAGFKAGGRRKQIEEIGMTSLFLATLAVWSRDETPKLEKTRQFLARRLEQADQAMTSLFPET